MIHILLLLVQVRVLRSDTMSNHEKLRTMQKRANIFPEAVYINKMRKHAFIDVTESQELVPVLLLMRAPDVIVDQGVRMRESG